MHDRDELINAFIDQLNNLSSYLENTYQGLFSGDIDDIYFKLLPPSIRENGGVRLVPVFKISSSHSYAICFDATFFVSPILFLPIGSLTGLPTEPNQSEGPVLYIQLEDDRPVLETASTLKDAIKKISVALPPDTLLHVKSLEDPHVVVVFEEEIIDLEKWKWIIYYSRYSLGSRPRLKDVQVPIGLQTWTYDCHNHKKVPDNQYYLMIMSNKQGTVDIVDWIKNWKTSTDKDIYVKYLRTTNLHIVENTKSLYDFMRDTDAWALMAKTTTNYGLQVIGGYKQFIDGEVKDCFIPEELALCIDD